MDGTVGVLLSFAAASAFTVYLILKRPFLLIRLRSREVRLETYFIGALLGPALIMAFGFLSYPQAVTGLSGTASLNPLGILILFFSMVFLSIYLDITGFFEYCARIAVNRAGGSGKKLFFSCYLAVSVLTIFTSNDIVILTFTPFVYYFAKHARVNPTPYLIGEFFAANTWSMMLYIGNPTNILLATAFELRFDEYFLWMFAPTVCAGVVQYLLLSFLFRKEIDVRITFLESLPPQEAITDKTGMFLGLGALAGCIITLSLAPYLGYQMWQVSLGFAMTLLIILFFRSFSTMKGGRGAFVNAGRQLSKTAGRMPWPVIPFVISLFITVEAMRIYGLTESFGIWLSGLSGSAPGEVFAYGLSSAGMANVINNIPMSMAYVSIIEGAGTSGMGPV
ncbi:MAG: SLC13 family permease, partial [Candidatus Thermoplasmatota archaeon]|nr:SLC13 family permease [Candidatus Thermoplasmatota archaeon]